MLKNKDLWETYFPQFLHANDPAVDQLMASASMVRLPGKQQVFYQGAACENYLLLLEGGVKVQLNSEHGREVLLHTTSTQAIRARADHFLPAQWRALPGRSDH